MPRPYKPKVGCSAKGGKCRRAAIRGGTVCQYHGGGAPQVKRAAQERLADLIDPDRALRTAAALAYSDIGDLYDENYRLRPMREWPPALRQAVKRIEPRLANVDPHDGEADRVLRLELHDKVKPLEMLFKHLGLLVETTEHKGTINFRWKRDDE